MGCASSKRMEAKVDVYRPAPTSFAVFDINAIEEPWLKLNNSQGDQGQQDKAPNPNLPPPLLHKLNKLETTEAPQSWADLSKALDDLKPNLADAAAKPVVKCPPPSYSSSTKPAPRKSTSFHTLEELDAKLNPKPNTKGLRKTESMRDDEPKNPETITKPEVGEGFKSVKENMFIVRDRMEREKEGREANYDRMAKLRRDPLSDFPEKCPPGGKEGVVIYTTSLGGVRKTFEECNKVREILESHRVVYDERDVSLHGEFLKEMKEMVAEEGVTVPRVFVKGRYVGGAKEVAELNDSGRLGRILNATRVERGIGRQACEGCGGARFVPCLECGGSCKVMETTESGKDVKRRCSHCNENGLVHCPACLSL
ncbi:hypothetical protein QN277_028411 [Acacia crassicarpa]|uniref:Glutaredoxin domain-containing protein n=1 Tax=Acacia crassicarpa TaxID=499986 RepID=A0AAE1J395_9FABA|nr:hypothetical protein QN277_028411 [Acacia crassicarpa]